MTAGRGPAAVAAARSLVGRRVRWRDDEHRGTVVDVTATTNGYVRWVVVWDEGAPAWWSTELAPSASGLTLEAS